MNVAWKSSDERLVARIVNLAYRFGCSYESLHVCRENGAYVAGMAFTGPAEALRRLAPQIHKLLNDDKEYSR